jgi:hypothetical protein
MWVVLELDILLNQIYSVHSITPCTPQTTQISIKVINTGIFHRGNKSIHGVLVTKHTIEYIERHHIQPRQFMINFTSIVQLISILSDRP